VDVIARLQIVEIVIEVLPAFVELPGFSELPKLLFHCTEPPLSETVIDCAQETPPSKKNPQQKKTTNAKILPLMVRSRPL
jgi:hypothetical protein